MYEQPIHVPSRQAILPPGKPVNPRAGDSMHGFYTGRVVSHNADSVNIMLETGQHIPDVPVGSRSSGSDRDDTELPAVRSNVVVGFAWGTKVNPFILCVLPRRRRVLAAAGKPVVFRRVIQAGTHMIAHTNGALELRAADGTFVVIGDLESPMEDYTGQAKESTDGNPLIDPAHVPGAKPAPFSMTVKMADGSMIQLKNGAIVIHGAGQVSLASDAEIKVDAPLIVLNGGTKPVARAGDPVDTPFGPLSGMINPLLAGNHTVLA